MSLTHKSLSAVFWSGADVFLRQGLQFFVSILLARLLSPEDFGVIAMLYIFIGVAGVFVDSGFSSALIQRQDITHEDESTVFFFNLGTGLLVALGLCFAAPAIAMFLEQPGWQNQNHVMALNLIGVPWIAGFFEQPILQTLTYVMALNVFVGSLGAIHNVLLTKALDFKVLMKIGGVASLLSGVLAVVLASRGFGVWSLALQTLASTSISVTLLWLCHPWRPQWIFSFASLRSLFRFGGFMLLSSLLDTLHERLYSVIIAKQFSVRELGFYNRGENIVQVPAGLLNNVLNRVAFPVFSAASVDKARLALGMRKVLRMIMLFNIPTMLGLAMVAEPVVVTLIGEKWLPSVPILQVLCLAGMMWPMNVVNLNVLKAQGHSKLFFRIEILKTIIGLATVVVASFHSILAIAWSQVILCMLGFLINAHYTNVFLGYSAWKQTRDLLPCFAISGLMVLAIWPIHFYSMLPPAAELGFTVTLGALVYLLTCRLMHLEVFDELWGLIFHRRSPATNLYAENS